MGGIKWYRGVAEGDETVCGRGKGGTAKAEKGSSSSLRYDRCQRATILNIIYLNKLKSPVVPPSLSHSFTPSIPPPLASPFRPLQGVSSSSFPANETLSSAYSVSLFLPCHPSLSSFVSEAGAAANPPSFASTPSQTRLSNPFGWENVTPQRGRGALPLYEYFIGPNTRLNATQLYSLFMFTPKPGVHQGTNTHRYVCIGIYTLKAQLYIYSCIFAGGMGIHWRLSMWMRKRGRVLVQRLGWFYDTINSVS